MITNNDINQYIKYLEANGFFYTLNKEVNESENGYENMSLVCLDMVLSINRQYYNFVVPRIKMFGRKYSGIKTIDDLDDLLSSKTNTDFFDVWNYKHIERVEILRDLVRVLKEKKDYYWNDEKKEIEFFRNILNDMDIRNNEIIKINGIGLASFQYLKMLVGIPTVKPDIHIKRSISAALKKENINDIDTIKIIESSSENINVSPRDIDRFIWMKFSMKSKNDIGWDNNNKEWK